MLRIKHLNKSYGKKKAIDDLSAEFDDGIYGLIGPNGAGKTTLLRIIATVLDKDSGEVDYGETKKLSAVRKRIGYLPQRFSLYGALTLSEGLHHIAVMKEIPAEKTDSEVIKVLDKVNLTDRADDRISSLSGGMLRRLGIGQALLGNPDILLVDEPTAGLDPEERIRFRSLLAEAGRSRTVIISTHIVEDVQSISDRILIMNRGRIIAAGDYKKISQLSKGIQISGITDDRDISDFEKSYMCIVGEDNEKNRHFS